MRIDLDAAIKSVLTAVIVGAVVIGTPIFVLSDAKKAEATAAELNEIPFRYKIVCINGTKYIAVSGTARVHGWYLQETNDSCSAEGTVLQ